MQINTSYFTVLTLPIRNNIRVDLIFPKRFYIKLILSRQRMQIEAKDVLNIKVSCKKLPHPLLAYTWGKR